MSDNAEWARMGPAIKADWIAALRSGRYEQGLCQLGRFGDDGEPRFCCLGVLSELAADRMIVSRSVEPGGGYTYGDERFTLPREVGAWASLPLPSVPESAVPDSLMGHLKPNLNYVPGDPIPLAVLNDTAYASFDELADIIESAL